MYRSLTDLLPNLQHPAVVHLHMILVILSTLSLQFRAVKQLWIKSHCCPALALSIQSTNWVLVYGNYISSGGYCLRGSAAGTQTSAASPGGDKQLQVNGAPKQTGDGETFKPRDQQNPSTQSSWSKPPQTTYHLDVDTSAPNPLF